MLICNLLLLLLRSACDYTFCYQAHHLSILPLDLGKMDSFPRPWALECLSGTSAADPGGAYDQEDVLTSDGTSLF